MPSTVFILSWLACGATPPAAPAPPATSPQAALPPQKATPAPSAQRAVLLASQRVNGRVAAVPLACDTGAQPAGGEKCPAPMGALVTVPWASGGVIGESTQVACEPNGASATGWWVEGGDPAGDGQGLTWGYLGDQAPALTPPLSGVPSPEVQARALEAVRTGVGWPFGAQDPKGVTVTVELEGDLDGAPGEERVLRLFRASDDPDKPGNSALYVDRQSVVPVHGFEFNGVVDVVGALPIKGGHIVLLRSEWMGGSGLHAMSMFEGVVAPLGQWVCGS